MKRTSSLKKTLKSNTTSSIKHEDGSVETIKEGNPLDHVVKRVPGVVGVSKGITKNMSNYESFRVDAWITDTVQSGETEKDALLRLSKLIEEHLLYEVENL